MLYILTSILFFLSGVRSILFWTAIWQKSGYNLRYLKETFTKISRLSFITRIIFSFILFSLIVLYGLVILNDSLSNIYSFAIMLFFALGSVLFIHELMDNSLIKPYGSTKALVISLGGVFCISFFYMIPLVDRYLWFLFMLLSIPLIIGGLVLLLGFPSEIYEDYVLQKTTESLRKNKTMTLIGFYGEKTTVTQTYLSQFLDVSAYKVIEMKENAGVLATVTALRKSLQLQDKFFIFQIPQSVGEMKKMLQVIKPHVLIFAGFIEEKNNLKKLEYILSHIPKQTKILIQTQDKLLQQAVGKHHRKAYTYGMQKTSLGKPTTIYGSPVKGKTKALALRVKIGKETFLLKDVAIPPEFVVYILPAVLLARKMGLPVAKIRAAVRKL